MKDFSISVMLVDDHPMVRLGYRRALEQHPYLQVVGEAAAGHDAYQLYNRVRPDIVVMDVSLPDISGIEATRKIVRKHARARVLISSMYRDLVYVRCAMKAGALGYITKASDPQNLCDALLQVYRRETILDPDIARRLAEYSLRGSDDPFSTLSPREFEICRMLLAGQSAGSIADSLRISAKTVANNCSALRNKLNVSSSFELFQLAMRQGLLER